MRPLIKKGVRGSCYEACAFKRLKSLIAMEAGMQAGV
jgi:hypothetical protein